MTSGGIFGPKLSGKTTLAIALSKQYFASHKMRSIVLDPHNEPWGQQAVVMQNEEKFWSTVWASKHCVIIVEEAAATIRRDRNLVPVFTRLRHCNHILIVVGHSGMDLLPVMRQQFDTIYLFRQPKQACVVWSDVFCNEELLQAQTLQQYEFLHCVMYGKARKLKMAL